VLALAAGAAASASTAVTSATPDRIALRVGRIAGGATLA